MTGQCDLVLIAEDEILEIVVDDGAIEVISASEQGPQGPPGTTNPHEFVLDWAPEIEIDWELGDIALLTLEGDCEISMIGIRKKCMLMIVQDGGSVITWDPATIGFGTDIPSITLSMTPGTVDYVGFAKNPVNGKFDLMAYCRGY